MFHGQNSTVVCMHIKTVVSFSYSVLLRIIKSWVETQRCERKVGKQILLCGNTIRTKLKSVLKRDVVIFM